MKAQILPVAEDDLAEAFDYYEGKRKGLGREFIFEFRRAVELIILHPQARQLMNPPTHRRCRLDRFPYGVIYSVEHLKNSVLIVAVEHLQMRPQRWRRRLQ